MELILALHNIRSTYNVGAILRTAEGFGVKSAIFSGYTPTPLPASKALPHIADKETAAIHKTALGAEEMVPSEWSGNIEATLNDLKARGYTIIGLENNLKDARLHSLNEQGLILPEKAVLLLGEEVHGIPAELLPLIDLFLEIPMKGKKESFNVSVATGIALYELLAR